MKKIPCKNTNCKHYYELKGRHCAAEGTCAYYSSDKNKSDQNRIKCINCKYCKRIIEKDETHYHYSCTAKGKERMILFQKERICDLKND